VPDRASSYRFPRAQIPSSHLAYGGGWRVEKERIVAGPGARLRLAYRARDVHLVLGGRGAVEVLVDGRRAGKVRVREHRLYTLVRGKRVRDGLLELRFAPGIEAYAFTFG
jgi:Thioredoxin like C-terminal domain